MFTRLLNILIGKKETTFSNSSVDSASAQDQFSIRALWNDFDRRTWHYERNKSILQKNDPRLLNWIGSIDYSGHTRERCLRYLISHFVPGDENRILLRLADWVPQVQNLAREWILKNFEKLSFEAMRKNDLLILYLSRKEMLSGDRATQKINDVLLAKVGSVSKKEFFALNPNFRRYLYTLSLNKDQVLRDWLLDDTEPFNRLLLLRHPACKQLTAEETTKLKSDRSVFVRRRFISAQIEKGIRPSQQDLIDFSLDRNLGLRELGRFYLIKYYSLDADEIYRSKKGSEFYYIADFAKKKDIEYFIQGLRSSNKDVRLICLRALSLADYHKLIDLDLEALILDNRKAREIICQHLPRLLSIEELVKLRGAFERSSPNGIVNYLKVLERKSYWNFVNAALTELLSKSSDTLFKYIEGVIGSKTALYERLPADLITSISKKLFLLKSENNKRMNELLRLLEFTMRTA